MLYLVKVYKGIFYYGYDIDFPHWGLHKDIRFLDRWIGFQNFDIAMLKLALQKGTIGYG